MLLKKFFVASLFLALSLSMGVGQALAHGVVDQSQTTASVYDFPTDDGWEGQTFTPTVSNMTGFDIEVSFGVSPVFFQIRNFGTDEILSTVSGVTLTPGINHIDLPSKIFFTPGTKHSILRIAGGPGFSFMGNPGNPYAGGAAIFEDVEESDFGIDLYFKTYYDDSDTTPPDVPTLLLPADGSVTNDSTPTFDWTDSSDPSAPVSYDLLVDNDSDFSSPVISEVGLTDSTFIPGLALSDALYYWKVLAKDAEGNTSAYTTPFSFTLDSTSPETIIDSVKDGNGADITDGGSTLSDSATFEFSSTEIATFECDLDGAGFSSCTSPKTYNGLGLGVHTFTVRAVDAVGNVDPTPAELSWEIITPKQAIKDLQQKVKDLDLPFVTKIVLNAYLEPTKSLLCDNNQHNDIGACILLKSFVKQVQQFSKQPVKTGVTADIAASLIEDAQVIRVALGCR